ncbi:hypothetical protein SAMN04488168_1029 [Bacillus sp. 491mf]|uniref:hypothetical protein n=1 Tax=Bacillus sp. 491mf TaxID=1761755 RepID=UPI0008EB3DD4|nr:hypothetical protein [Bacillus sp. 491mf]SFC09793.1 hypothetical protein SAMN04488168_1029 [Bacillus sp. 491mf]
MFKKGIVFVVGGFVLVGVILGGLQLFYKTDQQESKVEKAEQVKEDLSKNVPQKITAIHSDLNNITGWEKYEKYEDVNSPSWDESRSSFELIAVTLKEAVSLSNDGLKGDLERAEKLHSIAVKHHDTQALRYAHRIVHDLDIKVNGIDVNYVFNSAKAGDGSEVPVYDEYIKQHSK